MAGMFDIAFSGLGNLFGNGLLNFGNQGTQNEVNYDYSTTYEVADGSTLQDQRVQYQDGSPTLDGEGQTQHAESGDATTGGFGTGMTG